MPDPSLPCSVFDNPYLGMTLSRPGPGGEVLIDCHYHAGVNATRANQCDGPVIYLRVRNKSTVLARALLPNKKQGNPWLDGAPGADVILDVTSQPGDQTTLNNLGLINYSDVAGVSIIFP